VSGLYEEVDHTADWALRLQGKDLAELCLHAAAAMLAACGARPAEGASDERRITLQAPAREILLVRWLQEVLYLLDAHHRYPRRIDVQVDGGLNLSARWEEVPLAGVDKPIKAVTYSGLTVLDTATGLEATVVFDV
jgi:SHS2 domain-containing protein